MTLREKLLKLKERGIGATERPWRPYERGSGGIDREIEIRTATGGILFRSTSYGNMEIDGNFIVTAANSFDTLIDVALGLVKALEDARDYVDEQECRGDEDCDHCLVVHHTIDPALRQASEKMEVKV
jgi:hypothetical protein